MIEGDRPQPPRPARLQRPDSKYPTAGGEPVGKGQDSPSRTSIPKLTLDWERRAKILEQEVESQARLIVELKEELAGQDERIRRLEGLSVRAGMGL